MNKVTETQLTTDQQATLRQVARLIVAGSKGREQAVGGYFKRYNYVRIENACCAIGA